MKSIKTILAAAVMAVMSVAVMAQSIDTDPIVKAMREELKYSMDQLSQKQVPAYHMTLRMNDTYSIEISSNFGVPMTSEDRSRIITPQVRVGSPEMDNFKYECQTPVQNQSGVQVPFTDNAIMAVRQGIWKETMSRYDAAVNAYNQALSQKMTNADNEDKAPCFSDAPVEQYYEPAYPESAYQFDRKYWEDRMDRVSATFKECKYLEQGLATLSYEVERIYVVNSDGTAVVQNRKGVRLMLNGVIRATDGMSCPLYKDWFAYSLDDLPDDETLIAETRDLIDRMMALREAPIAEPYAGPAIMAGGASGVFFHEIFGHRLEAHRMKSGGQTFKKQVGNVILPECFNVYDDPTLQRYAGTDLYGSYSYDDEGVKAQRVNCVENGVLKNFLVDRTPIDGFPVSNGHGRAFAGYDAVSRQSNLVIETTNPYTEEQLRDMLVKAVKAEGKEYGYYFRTATSGLTYMGDGGSINSFGVDPIEVYRVFVDGRPDELVRGVTLIGTPLAMFSGIAAGGQTPYVFTGQCGAESGWVPVTAISPTIYITKVETQRSETGYQLPQVLEKPEPQDVTGEDSEVIFRAMSDEMERTMSSLKVEGQELPFYSDFMVNAVKSMDVTSSLGGTVSSGYVPLQLSGTTDIHLGDSMITNSTVNARMGMGQRVEYDCIRRELWYISDAIYKYAINMYSQKVNTLKTNPKPENEAELPELLSLPGGEFISPTALDRKIDRAEMEALANRLSAIYLDYPELYDNDVSININCADIYRLNSEGLKMRMPFVSVGLNTRTSVRTVDGSEIVESYSIPFDNNDYDEASIEADLREFAETMILKSKAKTVNDFYIGPILLERQAVAYSFNTIVQNYGSAQNTWDMYSRMYNYQNQGNDRLTGGLILGKRFLDPKLSIHLLSDLEEYNGIRLGGSYEYDYEGIRPEKDFVLVEKGILKHLMSGRTPGVGSEGPTGHSMPALYSITPNIRMTTMHVTCDKTVPLSKMKGQLIAEAKKAGLDHTYMLRNISYNCYVLTSIDVKTGEETVIHGNTPSFERRELMHVISASKEESIQSYPLGTMDLPNMIAPEGILLESIEMNLRKPDRAQEFQLQNPALR